MRIGSRRDRITPEYAEALKDVYEAVMRGPRERFDARAASPVLINHEHGWRLIMLQTGMLGAALVGLHRRAPSESEKEDFLAAALASDRWPSALIDESVARRALGLPAKAGLPVAPRPLDYVDYVARGMHTIVVLTAYAFASAASKRPTWRPRVDKVIKLYDGRLGRKLRRRGART
jgi:hypothetical protein